MLKKFFCPDEFADSFRDVDYTALYKGGIRGLLFDVDNTLEGYEAAVPAKETADFLLSLLDMGFKICFVSNNNRERIEKFNEGLGFPALYKSGKPGKRAVLNAAGLLGVPVTQVAIIGDQIFTDVYCGKRMGVHTALVVPVTSIDPLLVRLKRLPERCLLSFYKKNLKNS